MFEDDFQKPVHDKLAAIVIPLDVKINFKLDSMVPPTNYDAWMRQAQSFQDTQVKQHDNLMDDIMNGRGSIHGEFPTPRKRVRKRNKK